MVMVKYQGAYAETSVPRAGKFKRGRVYELDEETAAYVLRNPDFVIVEPKVKKVPKRVTKRVTKKVETKVELPEEPKKLWGKKINQEKPEEESPIITKTEEEPIVDLPVVEEEIEEPKEV